MKKNNVQKYYIKNIYKNIKLNHKFAQFIVLFQIVQFFEVNKITLYTSEILIKKNKPHELLVHPNIYIKINKIYYII